MGQIPVFNVKDAPYNAAGDGTTDDTSAINAAITACNTAGGGIVYVPQGTYMVDADYSSGGSIQLLSNVALMGAPGSILKAITNSLTTYAVIRANNVSNIVVRGLEVVGERSTHTGGSGEWGMCIEFKQVLNGRIIDCLCRDGWGDGVYLGSNNSGADPCEDIVVLNTICRNNRRNNVSVAGCKRGATIGCGFENANGTAPESGIDIEPNFPGETEDFIIDSCWSTGNAGRGYTVAAGAKSCKIVNCSSRGDTGYAIRITSAEDTLVANNSISDMTSAVRGAIDLNSDSVRTIVRGNVIRNLQTGQSAIFVHADSVSPVIESNYITLGDSTGITLFAPLTIIRGNYLKDMDGAGIFIGSSATDSVIEGNYIEGATGRAIYVTARAHVRHNTMVDITEVTGAFIQVAASAGAGFTLIGNVCKLTTPNTSITPFRADAAPAFSQGNVQIGMQATSAEYVGGGIRADVGDANITLIAEQGPMVIPYATTLTANRTVTLSTIRAYAGCYFRIVRTGLGAFTLNVGGLKTIPASTAAAVEVMHDGTAWQLIGYQLL